MFSPPGCTPCRAPTSARTELSLARSQNEILKADGKYLFSRRELGEALGHFHLNEIHAFMLPAIYSERLRIDTKMDFQLERVDPEIVI